MRFAMGQKFYSTPMIQGYITFSRMSCMARQWHEKTRLVDENQQTTKTTVLWLMCLLAGRAATRAAALGLHPIVANGCADLSEDWAEFDDKADESV